MYHLITALCCTTDYCVSQVLANVFLQTVVKYIGLTGMSFVLSSLYCKCHTPINMLFICSSNK